MTIGITSYGGYIPKFRIKKADITRAWGKKELPGEKSVANYDEDTATISVQASRNAIEMSKINPKEIGCLYVGSESHPYIIKPTATIVADAIGAGPELYACDLEFACKAGTASLQMALNLNENNKIKYGLAIGADTAQGRPNDALEFTSAAGGAAFITGKNPKLELIETVSYTTDTPDFWRREGQKYPRHGGRFTGQPAYYKHTEEATKLLLEKTGMNVNDFDHVIFHMPNDKFPVVMAKKLGIATEKLEAGFIGKFIGNTYSGNVMLGLAMCLDVAKQGEKILMTSFGSGAGSDSFAFELKEKFENPFPIKNYIENKEYVDYATYLRLRNKIKM